MDTVLVVGAGPTGLMLGCELLRHGLREVRVIDKAPAPSRLSKAIVVHARTLEIMEPLGVTDELVARGLQISKVQLFGDGKQIVQASFDELDTRFPFLLSIPQSETEAVLAARFAALGGRVERGIEVSALTQDDDGVSVTMASDGGRDETVRPDWVIGCDGAHSAVRKAIGLDFHGEAFAEPFMLADVKVAWDVADDAVTTFFAAAGLAACFPMPGGRWRLIMTAPPGDTPPTREDIEAALRERSGRACEVSDPQWLARFRINARQVERYRVGRVLLAGDAAHIHSPAGGQGMNTGLQDAHNLGWKLALVATGNADDRLLDSYHSERHGIGEGLLKATDYATRVATLKNPVARALRNGVAGFLTSLEVVQARLVRSTAELTLSYKKSPIVGERTISLLGARVGRDSVEETPTLQAWRHFALAPGPGMRAPDGHLVSGGKPMRLMQLCDHRHTLLLFDGRAATMEGYQRLGAIAHTIQRTFADAIAVHIVVPGAERPAGLDWSGSVLHDVDGDLEERYGAQAECLYLIRPDLYIGWRSQPADEDALVQHINGIFRLRPAA